MARIMKNFFEHKKHLEKKHEVKEIDITDQVRKMPAETIKKGLLETYQPRAKGKKTGLLYSLFSLKNNKSQEENMVSKLESTIKTLGLNIDSSTDENNHSINDNTVINDQHVLEISNELELCPDVENVLKSSVRDKRSSSINGSITAREFADLLEDLKISFNQNPTEISPQKSS